MKNLGIFLRGVLMGICDLIPGVSGGTIAFITGIYERLINAVSKINPENYFNLIFSKKRKELFKELDILFLVSLFLGIFTAIILGSKIISFLIDKFYIYVFAFFTGLILASCVFMRKQIDVRNHKNRIYGVLGILSGVLLLIFSPNEVLEPSNLMIFFGGFLAIFALFLPGISGSFILVILGIYRYIVNLVKDLDIIKLVPFAIGAGIGVFVISRLIKFLFDWNKSRTLYFLLGLVVGTLLIPVKNIYLNVEVFSFGLVFNLFMLMIFGFFIVRWIER